MLASSNTVCAQYNSTCLGLALLGVAGILHGELSRGCRVYAPVQ